ncbi:MAG: hypothetical protein K8S56_09690, partial [Candidatus Cloacimonetes bacterium]|nr:hypothetical protein [Candidatus Cloacimonadota bacterium]
TDPYKAAFALGARTADGIFVIKGRNKSKLKKTAAEMIEYSKITGLSEEILKLADELQMLIDQDKWKELEVTLDKYKQDVVFSLYEVGEFDIFILLQLGGWVEGLNRTAYLIYNNYDVEKAALINELGILNQLIYNVQKMPNKELLSEPYIVESLKQLNAIKSVLISENKEDYTLEQIQEIIDASASIKKAFMN